MWKIIIQIILQESVFSFHPKVYFWGHRKVLEFPLLPLLGLESNHSGVFSFITHFLISVVCPALMSARFRSPCSVSSYPVFKNPCHLTLNSELKFKATHKLVQPKHVIPEMLHLAIWPLKLKTRGGIVCQFLMNPETAALGTVLESWLLKWTSPGKPIPEWRSGTGHCG